MNKRETVRIAWTVFSYGFIVVWNLAVFIHWLLNPELSHMSALCRSMDEARIGYPSASDAQCRRIADVVREVVRRWGPLELSGE